MSRAASRLLLAALLAGAAVAARAAEPPAPFKGGIEALDYGNWREAAILLSEALDEVEREGGLPDVRVYGQRWVPYLPHFFLGAALFELGRFEEAAAEWRLSAAQLTGLERAGRSASLAEYKRRRSREAGFDERFFDRLVPASAGEAAADLAAARAAAERLETVAAALDEPAAGRLRGELADLRAVLAACERDLAAIPPGAGDRPAGDGISSAPEAFERAVERHRRRQAVGERARELLARLGELEQSATEGLLDGLRRRFELRRGSDAASSRDESAARAREPNALPARLVRQASGAGFHEIPARWARARDEAPDGGPPDGGLPDDETCGYTGPPARRLELALSDYLAGEALGRTLSCGDARAVALPRLRCSLRARQLAERLTPEARRPYRDLLARLRPHLAMARVAAACGDAEAVRGLLDASAAAPGAEERAAPDAATRTELEAWLAGGTAAGYPAASHALVVGVWDYEHWQDLPGVREDVERIGSALAAQGFDPVVVANPTRRQLERALAAAAERAAEGDRLVFYYAGHGHVTRSRRLDLEMGWIVPADAPRAAHPEFARVAVSMDRLRAWSLAELAPLRQQLFLFDSCFSGAVLLPGDRRAVCPGPASAAEGEVARSFPFLFPDRPAGGSIAELEASVVRLYVSAGTASERVPDASVFRRLLVDALAGAEPEADADGDGFLRVEAELAPFLKRRVPAASAQTPQYRTLCERGDFVFRLPGARRARREAAAPCGGRGSLLEEVYRWEALQQAESYETYLESHRCGLFLELARARSQRTDL